MDKSCFKCGQDKPLSEFYKHSRMADGYLNKCKACAKSDAAKHRNENLDRIRAYDRDRAKNPERVRMSADVNRLWRAADSRRVAAHNAVCRAIRKGELVRQPCERCGESKSLGHHEDYDKPLDVVWLCQPCHKERHKEMKACNDTT
jgi:ribosomal protein S27AE